MDSNLTEYLLKLLFQQRTILARYSLNSEDEIDSELKLIKKCEIELEGK